MDAIIPNIITLDMSKLTPIEQETAMELYKQTLKPPPRWKPLNGKCYFAITSYNDVVMLVYSEKDRSDQIRVLLGNAFETEKEALYIAERRIYMAKLQEYADKFNDAVINWENAKQDKFHIYFNHDGNTIDITRANSYHNTGVIYFTSYNLCRDAIEEIGVKNITHFIFNV